MSKPAIQQAADNLRIIAASMVESAKSGHPGGAMGGADFYDHFIFRISGLRPRRYATGHLEIDFILIQDICLQCCILS